MGLLELDRGDVVEGAVEAPVVVPVDPSGGGVLDVGPNRTWVMDFTYVRVPYRAG